MAQTVQGDQEIGQDRGVIWAHGICSVVCDDVDGSSGMKMGPRMFEKASLVKTEGADRADRAVHDARYQGPVETRAIGKVQHSRACQDSRRLR